MGVRLRLSLRALKGDQIRRSSGRLTGWEQNGRLWIQLCQTVTSSESATPSPLLGYPSLKHSSSLHSREGK